MEYILMDMERTLKSGIVHYWNQNRHGYTRDIDQAGRFSSKEADELVLSDVDGTTVKLSDKIVQNVLKGL